MYKKFILILSAMIICSSTTALAAEKTEQVNFSSLLDWTEDYYPDANLTNAIERYKKSDYSGCIQELISYVMKEPDDAIAYYYIAMSYANIGDSTAAVEAYQKVIDLTKDPKLSDYATKGKDCLTNGPTCLAVSDEQKDDVKKGQKTGKKASSKKADENNEEESAFKKKEALEKFINEPYGDGLSPEIKKQMKEGKLMRIQESINKKDTLENDDIQRIKNFDSTNSSKIDAAEKIAEAEPTDKEILKAIKTLRDAGINVSVHASQENTENDTVSHIQTSKAAFDDTKQNVHAQQAYVYPATMMNGYSDPQMAQISMMLGNNNNNSNSMMNMLPFLIQQNQSGQNIDPQLMQAVMLQQMMPSMDFGLNNNNN